MGRVKLRRWGRWMFLILAATAFFVGCKPTYLWVKAWLRDNPVSENLPPGYVDDASRLNRTQVAIDAPPAHLEKAIDDRVE